MPDENSDYASKLSAFASLVRPAQSAIPKTSNGNGSRSKKAVDNLGASERRAENPPHQDGSADESGVSSEETVSGDPRSRARGIIEKIGRQFVKLREQGRAQAWADLESELMTNAALLIDAGMISAKEWISMAIEIESFRKSEAGTQQLPGDFLAKWLNEKDAPAKKVANCDGD